MKEAAQRYAIELTSDEITELVAALRAREIALKEAINMAHKRKHGGIDEMQRRQNIVTAMLNRARIADK